MRTAEFLQNIPEISMARGVRIPRRLIRGFPLVSRLSLTAMMVGLAAAYDSQPTYSQNTDNKQNASIATLSEETIPQIPPNPRYFTVNTGERGKLYTIYGTGALPPNKNVSGNDTTEYSLIIGGNEILQARIQGNENLFPADTEQISTPTTEYNPKSDLIYLLNGYRQRSKDYRQIPLVILSVPRLKAADYKAQEMMSVSLPTLVMSDYISSFDLIENGNYLQIVIRNDDDPIKKTTIEVGVNENGKTNGKVRIKEFLRRLWLPSILTQFKPGFLTGWLG